ncbi:hypothetical protein BH10CHL1_BH10CHL1_14250 [soil metagenome]
MIQLHLSNVSEWLGSQSPGILWVRLAVVRRRIDPCAKIPKIWDTPCFV